MYPVARILVDTNVWYSRTLRDWLFLLYTRSSTPIFEIFWTEDILAELIGSLRQRHPRWDGHKMRAIRSHFTETLEGGQVTSFAEDLDFTGADPKDYHIHAAALACEADYVLTLNDARDFAASPDELPYELRQPDDFLMEMTSTVPELVRGVIAEQVGYFMERDGECDLPRALKNAGCPRFAGWVRTSLRNLPLPGLGTPT